MLASVFSSLAQPIASDEPHYKFSSTLSLTGPDKSATLPINAAPGNLSAQASPAQPKSRFIALIVPLTSRTLNQAADAVRAGFVAGAAAEGKHALPFRLYPAEDEGIGLSAAYRKALGEGAMAVVGGVTREGANVIAREGGMVPTLALNAPLDTPHPDKFYYVSLSLEHEARFLAREANTDSKRRAVVIAGPGALAKRLAESFEKEWITKRGEIVDRINVNGEVSDGLRIKTASAKWKDVNLAFIAMDAKSARLLRPYLPGGMPIYATSHSLNPYAGPIENLDLDNVFFLEMPWFVERDHPAVMSYAKPAASMALDYERLYALGIDAWRLTQMILTHDRSQALPSLDGVTGKLSLDSANQFVRSLAQVEMREGRPRLMRTTQ